MAKSAPPQGAQGAGIAMVVGSLTSAYSAYKAVETQNAVNAYNQRMLENQAEVARANVRFAEQKAEAARQAGYLRYTQQQKVLVDTLASQRAYYASSGVVVGEGSADLVERSTTREMGIDMLIDLYNAELGAWGYGIEAVNYGAQAAQFTSQAIMSGVQASPWLAASASFMQGLTGVAQNVSGMYSQGYDPFKSTTSAPQAAPTTQRPTGVRGKDWV